jgi:hypothetical protein
LVALPGADLSTFFLTCALLGGAVLVTQLVLGLLGAGHHGDAGHFHIGDAHFEQALDLFSVRALAAGLTFFGLIGLGVLGLGLPALLAWPAGIVAGVLAALGVAYLVRSLLKFEQDNTMSLDEAVGTTGTVYLGIPGSRGGVGKVHLVVRNRTVECTAVTPEAALATGAPVLVIDISGDDTVVVVSHPPSAEVPSHAVP